MSDPICQKIKLWRENNYPYLIHEFKHSLFVVGEHQFYKGYSLLFLKEHVRDFNELDENTFLELSKELYLAGQAIFKTFSPWKMNYQSLGNKAPHIHWHIIPRYTTDKYHKETPMTDFILGEKNLSDYIISGEQAKRIAAQIRPNL